MKTIAELKASLPQKGQVKWIGIRPKKKAPLISKDDVQISTSTGIEGDHYSKDGGKRMVTLIQAEHLKVVGELLDQEVLPESVRRNIVVSGINLNALQDAQFTIGEDIVLQGTGFCHPCSRMEKILGDGGYNAMRGHGGITARVIIGGNMRIGDTIGIKKD